jgi:hypothetical protein
VEEVGAVDDLAEVSRPGQHLRLEHPKLPAPGEGAASRLVANPGGGANEAREF